MDQQGIFGRANNDLSQFVRASISRPHGMARRRLLFTPHNELAQPGTSVFLPHHDGDLDCHQRHYSAIGGCRSGLIFHDLVHGTALRLPARRESRMA